MVHTPCTDAISFILTWNKLLSMTSTPDGLNARVGLAKEMFSWLSASLSLAVTVVTSHPTGLSGEEQKGNRKQPQYCNPNNNH